jgi:hypothetical protein
MNPVPLSRSGVFSGLRRRRWALGLALGYALLLNALLAGVLGSQAVAAALDPLAAPALCGEDGRRSGGEPADPRHHQNECPLCGPACPMTGGAALAGGTNGGSLAAPRPTDRGGVASVAQRPGQRHGPSGLFPSDLDSQAPPAA